MPELQKVNYNKKAAYEYWSEIVAPKEAKTAKIVEAIFNEEVPVPKFEEWLHTEDADRFKIRGIRRVNYEQLDPKAEDYKQKLDSMSKEQVNNAIFDLQWGIITNEASMVKLFNPGSFDVQKKASRIISIARSKENNLTYDELMSMSLDELDKLIAEEISTESVNILDAKTQTYFFKQNMTAGKLIGVFANANVSHVFCNLLPITVKLPIRFNGKSYKNAKWDPTYSETGRFVSKNIAGYVGASVDAVKDPVFANMNINMNTVNAALILTRLGVNPEEIALLTSQPIIVEFSKRMDAAKDKSSYVDPSAIMEELLAEYGTVEEISVINSSLDKHDFTAKELFDNIKNEDIAFSLKVGVMFRALLDATDDMKGITYCTKFNSITNAPGPLFTDNLYARERVNNFIKKVQDGNTMFSIVAADIIKKNPIIKSIYDATIGNDNIVEKIASKYWKYYNPTFTYISKKLSQMLGRPVKGETLEKVYQDYLLFCLYKAGLFSVQDNVELISKFPDKYMDTIKKIEKENPELYERELKYNPIIQRIKRATPTDKLPVPTLTMESGKMNGEVSEETKNGWTSLITSSNNDIRELGITLFFYNIYRSGFKFSPKTFLHLAPTDVKYSIANYIEYISDNSLFVLQDFESYNFILQYCRNHPDEFLSNGEETIDAVADGDNLDVAIKDVTIAISPFNKAVQPIIKMANELYVAEKSTFAHNVKSVKYIKVSRLGIENDVVEYIPDGSKYVPSSIAKMTKKEDIKKPTSTGLMSEGMTEKTSYKKNTGETDEVNKTIKKTPVSQLNENQLTKLLSTIEDESIKELLPYYSVGGVLNASMSIEEMVDSVLRNILGGTEVSQSDMSKFEEMKTALGGVHNQIINIIKDIC